MGYDAYQLVAPLFVSRSGIMPDLDGATGTLRLRSNGSIQRELPWAEFVAGQPVPLPDATAPDAEAIDIEAADETDAENWPDSAIEL